MTSDTRNRHFTDKVHVGRNLFEAKRGIFMLLLDKYSFLKYKFLENWNFKRYLLAQHRLQRKQYSQLLHILSERKITTFFQPIIEVNGQMQIGFEALNRPVPSKQFPTTEEFYQFLGDTEQIFRFEKLTRQQSIEKYVEKRNLVGQFKKELLFLNVHPYVLTDANYKSGQTLELVEKFGLDPQQIVFEITEKQSVQNYPEFERVLANYRSQGFKIAIDDVGAGYNSLKTIRILKPDFIKLDRSFIQHIDQNVPQQKLVELFVQYASQSNTKVIAEGVERKEELDFLREIKVDYAQGYYLGKPSEKL